MQPTLLIAEMTRSKLQKQVLRLYRDLMRAGQQTPGLNDHIRNEFKKNAVTIKRNNFLQIEHLIRLGMKKVKEIKKGSWTSMGRFSNWELEWELCSV